MKPELLQTNPQTEQFGRNIFHFQTVDSTNEWAATLASLGAETGTVVVASSQMNGHGRQGRKWFSPEGGLWLSIILRPLIKPAEASKLTFVAGLAAAKTLRREYGLKVHVKWPNDVLVDGKKVCGVLCEMKSCRDKVGHVIVGFGINANLGIEIFPSELREAVISLKSKLGHEIKLAQLFDVLLHEFENAYSEFMQQGFRPLLDEWKTYAADFLGKIVTVRNEIDVVSGRAVDVNQDGALILELENHRKKPIYFGDLCLQTSAHAKSCISKKN